MPEKLSDVEVQNILDAYDDEGSYAKAAEKTNRSKSVVQKYVKRHEEAESGAEPDDTGSSVVDLSGGDESLVDLTDRELMNMNPAEFIQTFFQEFDDMGVRDSFVQMIANQSRLRKQIPDEDQMAQRIQSHSSGVGNANDANTIAELYWGIAQRYLSARGLTPQAAQMGVGNAQASSAGGNWVGSGNSSVSMNRQPATDSGGEGDWVSTAGTQQFGGQQQPQPNQPPQQTPQNNAQGQMAMMMQKMMQQQQQMMSQMMEDSQATPEDDLRAEVRDLKAELAADSEDESMTDSLKEVMELREMLETFEGDDDSDQMEDVVGVLQQQLGQLQQEIRDESSSVDMGQIMSDGDSQFGLLAAMAQNGDVDPSQVLDVAQNLGEVETNPDVAEKKYEKEIEKMRVEAQQEKWDSILDGAEQLATSLGGALAGGDDLSQQTDTQQEVGEPDVTAKSTEGSGEPTGPNISPAQQMIQDAGEQPEAEPKVEAEPVPETEPAQAEVAERNVEPVDTDTEWSISDNESTDDAPEDAQDTAPEPAESEVMGEVEQDDAVENRGEAKADGGKSGAEAIVCPHCGRGDFDGKRAMWGHKGSCPEKPEGE